MSQTLWARRPPPQRATTSAADRWEGAPATAADLTALRVRLHAALLDGARPPGATDDDVERLLLAFEELTSNGLRHGQAPVRVTVVDTGTGWLIDVTDAAVDRPPVPAVGRDAAEGGLGLYLVARLCAAHGWTAENDRKHVWARIDYTATGEDDASPPPSTLPRPRRPRG
ncbi:anti-sigma regulatory factor (Ser/Thr protein kinase) [Blastococcus colisei]|uniref:Anti-sigma regulatory factor (Ser/Thr protein kinase) n=1 Tax=Blastococcus colisei TaxID=1564162 RepID=A0A543PIY4_9ACTN|nr:ATP-binding protein [Blastococcus colisei]TQN44033.1 anti-sigma regulatory factor (Ser/Thr protein kinase) [Blastococcus colisei]